MRAVSVAFCVAGLFAAVVSASPHSREKRFAIAGANPFFPGFGAFAGNPYTAAFAGNPFGIFGAPFGFAQAGINNRNRDPFFSAVPNYSAFMPVFIPTMPEFKNWFEGPNVCKEEKLMNTQLPDGIPADWKADMPNVDTDMSHEQETCKGNNNKYVCVKRMMGNGGTAEIKATKYECCHGFVRYPNGAPGCVESKQSESAQGTDGKLTQNEPTYYVYSGNNMQSGSSSSSVSRSSSGNLDKVPLQ